MGDQVYLGYVDEEIKITNKDEEDPYCTKVGGSPAWISSIPATPCCGLCKSVMVLVIQAYSPLNILPTHERVLYIFVCVKPGCSSKNGGWCVMRSHTEAEGVNNSYYNNSTVDEDEPQPSDTKSTNNKKSNNSKSKKSKSKSADDNWATGDSWGNDNNMDDDDNNNNNDNDWGGDDTWRGGDSSWGEEGKEEMNDDNVDNISTKLEDLLTMRDQSKSSSQSKQKKGKEKEKEKKGKEKAKEKEKQIIKETPTKSTGFFVPHYLVVEEEPDSKSTTKQQEQEYYDVATPSDTDEWAGEEYEYAPDRLLNKFFKKLELSPMQCLRYKFSGTPLLMYEEASLNTIPPCPSCGAARTFELQLMSTLIFLLRPAVLPAPQLDFGIVAIFVCSKSCVSSHDGVMYEYAHVQPENK